MGISCGPVGTGGRGVKADVKAKAQARLKRAAGQVAGIQRMVEEDRYCVDVLLQIAAARAALDQVGKLILAGHVETCVATAFESGSARERRKKMDELLEVFSRFGGVDGR
jgi:DNA-binding FrmR family transcriptional regulator